MASIEGSEVGKAQLLPSHLRNPFKKLQIHFAFDAVEDGGLETHFLDQLIL